MVRKWRTESSEEQSTQTINITIVQTGCRFAKKKEMSVEVFVSTREKRKTDAVTPAALRDFPEGSVHGQMVREWGCWDWEKQMNVD